MASTATGGVSAKVRSARAARLALVAGQSALLGLSAALVALAAASTGGRAVIDAQTIAIAALTAFFAGASWWIECDLGTGDVASAIDRQEGLAGALTTAFESEASGSTSALARLLSDRVGSRVSVRRYASRLLRSSVVLLAVPFAALAVLAYARDAERRGSPVSPSADTEAGRGAGSAAADIRRAAERVTATPGLDPKHLAEARRLALRAEDLAARAQHARTSPRELVLEAQLLERRLAELLEATRTTAVAPQPADGTMEGPDARARVPDEPSMPEPRSHSAPAVRNPAGEVPGAAREGGVGSPRWWPSRYDAVVERWLETRELETGTPRSETGPR